MKYEGVPIDWCSQLYVGDIDIKFENVVVSQISHENKYEYLVVANEEPRSTSPSPRELQQVDQIKKKDEEEVPQQEPIFLKGSLKMSEMNIHEALSIPNDTKALVSNSCWKFYSLEDPSLKTF